MIKFTECLNDTWDYFFLGDPSKLSLFKSDNNLSNNLISEFTENNSGDLVVEKGALIPLSGIANYPYHIFFQINSEDSIFDNNENDLQFKRVGYFLEIVNQEIYLMTIPYLKNWTEENGINSLKSNGIRPKINLENGFYSVEILGGETNQESGWEPTLEFILKKKDKEIKLTAEDVNFKFQIKSKEY
ncbi:MULTISPECIES: hypothetical protein [Flavobacteriaceae]|jgi:hypothetical protein|uniref:hypothetical protein n=1 Tax=Flavobacteriaceae TaxID=49546 RepID=UPI00201B6F9A|nr:MULTISPECIES: hypothetical protein [Flavobacteriaceae]MCL5130532.1 hypothetical protein [Algibacter sp. L4_22]WKX75891.1 hypothetical protein Q5W13_20215 [Zobellia laminariae]